MYNGIGLQTPRGSGTNGHVQRNFAFVRPSKKDKINYRTEEDIAKLDLQTNRQPNLEILDHERKRKIEVKCAEFEEVLEAQGFSEEDIQTKVGAYRAMLLGNNNSNESTSKDEHGRPILRETHEIAQAQQQKNAKLREAFGISNYFVEGTSFDPERKAREELAQSEATQKELQADKDADKINRKKYALVRTPSPEKFDSPANESDDKIEKKQKKKKKHNRDASSSPDRKKDKKKKSKKHKKDRGKKKKSKRRHNTDTSDSSSSDSSTTSESSSSSDDSDTEEEKNRRRKKTKKNKKKKSKKKRHESRVKDLSEDSSVERRTLKSHKIYIKPKEKEENKYSASRKEVTRKSRSRDRVNRRSNDRRVTRRSRSRSVKKSEQLKKKSASPKRVTSPLKSPDRTRVEKTKRRDENDDRTRTNRSKPVQNHQRSPSPKKMAKRKSPTPKRNDRNTRRSRSARRRSVSTKRYENSNRKSSPTPRKHLSEKKRSPSPQRHSSERKIEKLTEKRGEGSPFSKSTRKRSLSRDHQSIRVQQRRSSSRNRRQQRKKSPVSRKRSASRSRSPILRKTSRYSRSPARHLSKGKDRCRQNERRSRSRSLSYSPARRNPEKYRKILDTKDKSNEKVRKPAPVVKLHPTTSDRDSSENETPEGRKFIDEKVEDFLPIDQNQDRELNRLRALKSELAVKAKESLEKKIISETTSILTSAAAASKSSSRNNMSPTHNIEPERAREMEIVAQTVAISTKEKQAAIKAREDKRKISIKPFKIDGTAKGGDVAKSDLTLGLKPSDEKMSKERKSRSHSRTSLRSRDVSSSSSGSSHSRSSSGSTHSDASSTSSSSGSDEPSRPRSRGHSGSIPRRAGSPSFLDRRRITRSRSRSPVSRSYRRSRR